MATKFWVNKDFQGINGFATLFTDEAYQATLTGATNTQLAVPLDIAMGFAPATTVNNTFLAIFHYASGVDCYVANNADATPPGTAAFAVSSTLNPTGKIVKAGDVLNFYSTAGGDVCVEFFSTVEN